MCWVFAPRASGASASAWGSFSAALRPLVCALQGPPHKRGKLGFGGKGALVSNLLLTYTPPTQDWEANSIYDAQIAALCAQYGSAFGEVKLEYICMRRSDNLGIRKIVFTVAPGLVAGAWAVDDAPLSTVVVTKRRKGDKMGLFFVPDTAVLQDVEPGSLAAAAGLRPGDKLISINGAPWGDLGAQAARSTLVVTLQVRKLADSPTYAAPSTTVPVAIPLDGLVHVTTACPVGSKAGDPIRIEYQGQQYDLAVPAGISEGQSFTAAIPVVPVAIGIAA